MAPRKGLTPEVYIRLASEGFSQSETARILGVTPQTVKKVAERNKITFVMGYKSKEKRDADRGTAQAAGIEGAAAAPRGARQEPAEG